MPTTSVNKHDFEIFAISMYNVMAMWNASGDYITFGDIGMKIGYSLDFNSFCPKRAFQVYLAYANSGCQRYHKT